MSGILPLDGSVLVSNCIPQFFLQFRMVSHYLPSLLFPKRHLHFRDLVISITHVSAQRRGTISSLKSILFGQVFSAVHQSSIATQWHPKSRCLVTSSFRFFCVKRPSSHPARLVSFPSGCTRCLLQRDHRICGEFNSPPPAALSDGCEGLCLMLPRVSYFRFVMSMPKFVSASWVQSKFLS